MSVSVETVPSERVGEVLSDVSKLRVEVFRAWPYLYDGEPDAERAYLAEFAAADDAVVVVARDGDAIVGAATASPLLSHTSHFADLFAQHGHLPERVFYFGESVLLSAYRGHGIGHAFFDHREAAARAARTSSGETYQLAAFCGVVRPDDDPRRPEDYRPLDPFWRKRGFAPVSGMIGNYDWQEAIGAPEIAHEMQFWVKPL